MRKVRARLDSAALQIDHHEHILLYGPSYMRQLFFALACNNAHPVRIELRACIPRERGHELEVVDRLFPPGVKEHAWLNALGPPVEVPLNASLMVASRSDFLTLTFPSGGSLTSISNCRITQDISRFDLVLRTARELHRTRGSKPFTDVAIMVPHPPCWFRRFDRHSNVMCVAKVRAPSHKDRMTCEQAGQLAQAIAPGAPAVSVTSWTEKEALQFDVNCSGHGIRSELRLFPILGVNGEYGCSEPRCQKTTFGHQCQPGIVEILAQSLLSTLRRSH